MLLAIELEFERAVQSLLHVVHHIEQIESLLTLDVVQLQREGDLTQVNLSDELALVLLRDPLDPQNLEVFGAHWRH